MSDHGGLPTRFAELRVQPGDAFSVETITPPKRYPVRLIGYSEGDSLLVSTPRIQGKTFLLPEGQLLRVRMMADNIACGFETRVLHNCRTPFLYAHLAYPKSIKSVAVRQASRVALKLPAIVAEFEPGALPGQWPKKGLIIDMSSGGARLHSKEPVAAVGSELRLRFRVMIDTVERDEQVRAIVRNITEVGQGPEDAGYQYGLQFMDVGEEDRIRISGYVYEQILHHGKGR
ncbi:flagellar brake protein [Motiliproteus sediminis]|uniref:flagellar brake protein n=1 Tax=Motiliproteus sediminis TaxID=1468178 RepID=UPI001AEF38F2|nr:flagellar brake protein [Motiliproteus sediminis]